MPSDGNTFLVPWKLMHEVWPQAMNALPRPLTPEVVKADVSYLLDRYEATGEKFPSIRKLATRWDWSPSRVARFLKRGAA